ncbi:MAG: hypothetical protein QOG89_1717 [Thermomicrobiales bacterium]|nr:hypothetical protein [Thermomicrobiales bacterium]
MDEQAEWERIIAVMSVRIHQSTLPRPRPKSRPRARPRTVVRPSGARRGGILQARILAAVAVGLFLLVLVHELTGLNRMQTQPVLGSDYVKIAEYVAARHKPGEPVFVAIPTQAYLALGSRDDLIFISSPLDRERAQRYSRLTSDGRYVDYWTGVRSIVSTGQLCQALLTSPDLWLLVDGARLNADWAYLGDMATVINGLTYMRSYDLSGAMVRRLAPIPSRDPLAEKLCAKAMELEGLSSGS